MGVETFAFLPRILGRVGTIWEVVIVNGPTSHIEESVRGLLVEGLLLLPLVIGWHLHCDCGRL